LKELVSGLVTALDTFDSPVDMTNTASTLGVRPTTLDELMAQQGITRRG
jgi:hypothetical protein